MDHKNEFSGGLTGLERTLQELTPAPPRLSIPHTMFLAGREAGRHEVPRTRFWPAVSAGLALLSIMLAVLLAVPREPQIVYVTPRNEAEKSTARPPGTPRDLEGDSTRDILPAPPQRLADDLQKQGRDSWTSPLNSFAWRQLALQDRWDAMPLASNGTTQSAIPALRYDDWKKMLERENLASNSERWTEGAYFNWTRLLQIRGS